MDNLLKPDQGETVQANTHSARLAKRLKTTRSCSSGQGASPGLDASLVGRLIRVWCPTAAEWRSCQVQEYHPRKQTHAVKYADGKQDTVDLHKVQWGLEQQQEESHQGAAAAETAGAAPANAAYVATESVANGADIAMQEQQQLLSGPDAAFAEADTSRAQPQAADRAADPSSRKRLRTATTSADPADCNAPGQPDQQQQQQQQRRSRRVQRSSSKAAASATGEGQLDAATAAAAGSAAPKGVKKQPRQKQQQPGAAAGRGRSSRCGTAAQWFYGWPRHMEHEPAAPVGAAFVERARQAAAAAGRKQLPPGKYQLIDGKTGAVTDGVDGTKYRIGDLTGGRYQKLFRVVEGKDGSAPTLEQLSKSCHDCQGQHVFYSCQHKSLSGGREVTCTTTSSCNCCALRRYSSLGLDLGQLQEQCAPCRGICTCREHLRDQAAPRKLAPPLSYSSEQLKRFGEYSLAELLPHLAQLIKEAEAELSALGVSGGLESLSVAPLTDRERASCDRCASLLLCLTASCQTCGWEVCTTCITDLRKGLTAPCNGNNTESSAGDAGAAAAAAAADAGGSVVDMEQLTCCNPECSSVNHAVAQAFLAEHTEKQQQEAGGLEEAQEEEGQGGQGPLVKGCNLRCMPGGCGLKLQLVVTEELHEGGKLQELIKMAKDYEANQTGPSSASSAHQPSLGLSACPLVDESSLTQLSQAGFTWEDLQGPRWWQKLPAELRDVWRRKASSNSWLFTPHADDLTNGSPHQALALALLWAQWSAGRPVIVRGIKAAIRWDPETMLRAVRDMKEDRKSVTVLDCSDMSELPDIDIPAFFRGGREGLYTQLDGQPQQLLLKLKDFPPGEDFAKEMPRHFADFIQQMPEPLRCFLDPRSGASPLNLASALNYNDNPTDLGPKTYIAYGRVAESDSEGDSVTKLHEDMSGAVNILPYQEGQVVDDPAAPRAPPPAPQQPRCGDQEANKPHFDGAGAVWHIGAREQRAPCRTYLLEHMQEFVNTGKPLTQERCPVAAVDPHLSSVYMVTAKHREGLLREQGVEMWEFEQHQGEAVFVPAGCGHQVRNLTFCCKVAVDFASPDSTGTLLQHRDHLRSAALAVPHPLQQPPPERTCAEKLQAQLMLLKGVLRAHALAHGQPLQQQEQQQQPKKSGSRRAKGSAQQQQQPAEQNERDQPPVKEQQKRTVQQKTQGKRSAQQQKQQQEGSKGKKGKAK